MSSIKSFIITLLACAVLFSGCKKKDQGPAYQIAFTFNGNSYTMLNPTVVVNTNGLLTSVGHSGNTSVALQFVNAQPGNVPVGEGGSITFATSSSVDDVYSCSSGTITITTYNSTNISGTFDTAAARTEGDDTPKPVKGSFNIKIQ